MKKISKVLITVLSLALVMSLLVGCNASTSEDDKTAQGSTESTEGEKDIESAEGEEDETIEIVYVAHGLKDMFSNWLVKSVEESIAKDYPNYKLEVLDGQLSADVQNEQLENAIAKNPDMIFYTSADGYSATPTVKKAQDAGIPVILLQSPIYDDNDEIATPYVDCDMYEVGKMIANHAADLIPENAEITMLLGPAGNVHSQMREDGWNEVLAEKRPDITVVDIQMADWDTAEAMRITEDWLQQFPDLKAVVSMNDSMILGAIEAARAADRELLTFGVDGMADGCNAVKNGTLTATALQDARLLADGGLQLAARIVAGEELTGEDVIHVEGALITLENVDEFLAIHGVSAE